MRYILWRIKKIERSINGLGLTISKVKGQRLKDIHPEPLEIQKCYRLVPPVGRSINECLASRRSKVERHLNYFNCLFASSSRFTYQIFHFYFYICIFSYFLFISFIFIFLLDGRELRVNKQIIFLCSEQHKLIYKST